MKPHNNPSYVMTIDIRDGNGRKADQIKVNLPENIPVGVQSVWEARLPGQTLSTFMPGNVLFDLLNADALIKAFSFQSWRGSGPLEFNFSLQFAAEDDAWTDVIEPCIKLQKLVLPTHVTASVGPAEFGILMPPGPSLIYPNRNRISLRIGRLLYIPSVIIRSAEVVYDTLMDARGHPQSASMSITFCTIDTPSREEFEGYFLNSGDPNDDKIDIGIDRPNNRGR